MAGRRKRRKKSTEARKMTGNRRRVSNWCPNSRKLLIYIIIFPAAGVVVLPVMQSEAKFI